MLFEHIMKYCSKSFVLMVSRLANDFIFQNCILLRLDALFFACSYITSSRSEQKKHDLDKLRSIECERCVSNSTFNFSANSIGKPLTEIIIKFAYVTTFAFRRIFSIWFEWEEESLLMWNCYYSSDYAPLTYTHRHKQITKYGLVTLHRCHDFLRCNPNRSICLFRFSISEK